MSKVPRYSLYSFGWRFHPKQRTGMICTCNLWSWSVNHIYTHVCSWGTLFLNRWSLVECLQPRVWVCLKEAIHMILSQQFRWSFLSVTLRRAPHPYFGALTLNRIEGWILLFLVKGDGGQHVCAGELTTVPLRATMPWQLSLHVRCVKPIGVTFSLLYL